MKTQTWYTLKRLIPISIYSSLVKTYFNLRGIFYSGNKVECPCCKRNYQKFVLSGLYGSCPGCGAGSRHRNLYYFLENEKHIFKAGKLKILHFAPENGAMYFFSRFHDSEYITADLNSPRAQLKIDMTKIPFEKNFFDVVISVHVLEHVSDDLKAMKELYRILKPGGYSIHQVPIDYNLEKTYEEEKINTNELRDKFYGHPDHKRIYGRDYIYRLHGVGFNVQALEYFKNIPIEVIQRNGLNPAEVFYICTK